MVVVVRRGFLGLLLLMSCSCFSLDLELTQGINSALPIAINAFKGHPTETNIDDIINTDLSLSGQFNVVSGPKGSTADASYNDLQKLGADSVVIGSVKPLDGQHFEVNFELVDAVMKGRILLSRTYQVKPSEFRALAHHISDQIYQKLTGEKGVFSTRIAYILVQGEGERRQFSLEVADADGYNPQSLLLSKEPLMSPSWSPNGKLLAYVSFEKKRAQIYTVSVETGQRRLITSFPGINGAPAWSPDGKELAVVLSKGGSPKLYSVNLNTGNMKQLTFGGSIDTEPKYSPDGKSILFTSNRGGSPQIYQLTLADGQVQRVTFKGNYNAHALFTPDQKNIIMLHREDKQFNIAIQALQGNTVTPLTFSPMDESPTLAPNGRLIIYATQHQDKGVLGIVSIDGRIHMRFPDRKGHVQEPAWSPYLG